MVGTSGVDRFCRCRTTVDAVDRTTVHLSIQNADSHGDLARHDVGLGEKDTKPEVAVHHLMTFAQVDASHVVLILHETVGQLVHTLIILVLAKESVVVEALGGAELVYVGQNVSALRLCGVWCPLGQRLGRLNV